MKCAICERRPARTPESYCANCASQIDAERHKRAAQSDKPVKFLTYRSYVVGLYPNGNGTLKPQLLRRSPDNLPKTRTLDLNRYCDGFTRQEVKRFKACILQLANA